MMINVKQARDEIVACGKMMKESELVTGSWGNISMRVPDSDHCAITPSGVDYDRMKAAYVVIVD